MVLPKFRGQRRRADVERRAEETLGENRDEAPVLLRINGTEKLDDRDRGDDHNLLLVVQVAE